MRVARLLRHSLHSIRDQTSTGFCLLQVGPEDHVICALSGGVDSTVAATLVHKVLRDRLHCVFVDNGLLRYKEAERVMDTFQQHLHLPVTKIDGAARLLKLLKVSLSALEAVLQA